MGHVRGEIPLLGRDDDLARLTEAVGLDDGRGGIVVLAGPAGIGKTRLVTQLARDATAADVRAAFGHCVGQAGTAIPYLPFTELLGTYQRDNPQAFTNVLTVHPILRRLLPGSGTGDPAMWAGDTADPGAIAEAVHAALTAAGAEQPLLLVIEDVHWAAHSTRDLLTLLMTRGFDTAVSLVITYRSDDLHRRHPLHETLALWARLENAEHLSLGPLDDDAIRKLVVSLGVPGVAEKIDDIARRAEGNPFFAEELAAAAGPLLSENLTRVLRARYEGLEPRARAMLRAIATHGRRIDHELLTRVVKLDPEALDDSLREAIESGMVTVDRSGGYAFRHALLAEAISEDLLPGERTRLHHAFVAALTAEPGLAPASELERHAAASGETRTAIDAAIRAGRDAYAMGGPRDALDHFERALAWMGEDDPARDSITIRAAQAAHASGEVTRAIEILSDRITHPGIRQTDDGRARLLAAFARQARYSDHERGVGDRAAEAYALVSPAPTRARLEVLMAYLESLIDRRELAAAAPIGEEARALAAELGLGGAEIELRSILARAMYQMGDLESLEAHLRGAVADARVADPSVQVLVRLQLANLEHSRGRLREELALYDDAMAIGDAAGRTWSLWETLCRTQAAQVAYELGEFDGALARLTVGGPPPPRGVRATLRAASMVIRVARDDAVGVADLDELRQWWPHDAYAALLSMAAAVEVHGREGRVDDALAAMRDGVATLDAAWGDDHEAIIRLTALLAGVLGDAVGTVDRTTAERLVAVVGEYAERATRVAAGVKPGEESRAWVARMEADVLRLRWRAGEPAEPAALIEAWRGVVDRFAAYGHAYELARSQLRLAEVLAAAGRRDEARPLCDAVREAAERLPSEPLRRGVVALVRAAGGGQLVRVAAPAGAPADRDGAATWPQPTAREMEVLRLLARGKSNGQIAAQLFISVKTASVHVTHLLAKFGASSRGEAVALARDRGLID